MLPKALFISLLALSVTPFLGACRKSHKKRAAVVQYFIHGDPLSLVNNAVKAPSFLTPANIANFKDFHFAGGASFIEREPQAAPTTIDQVEDDNSTTAPSDEIESQFELLKYEFVATSATHYVYQPENNGKGYKLGFDLVNGLLVMTDYNGYAVTPHHYSLKADGSAFSILLSLQDNTVGKVLVAFYFASSQPVNPIVKAADYAYLYDTVKVGWDEPIKVESCGSNTAPVQQSIDASVKGWFADSTPSATTRPVTYSSRTTYAPFSDLNQHCIFLISAFKLENSVDFYTAGATFPVINLATKHIIDSDVMIFLDHKPIANQFATGEASATLLHEMGHFYGLGHEFRKDAAGAALHPSIMGYSTGTDVITAWDFSAIRELYTESLSLAP